MFNWLKRLFGKKDETLDNAWPFPTAKGQEQFHAAPYKVEAPVVSGNVTLGNNTVSTVSEKKKSKPAKISTNKKAVDLDAMKKDDLLAHAKKLGAKANASMKKADIISAIEKAG